MRKVLISVLVGLMIIGSCFFMVNGFSKIKVYGAKGIDQKDTIIEEKISELSDVISITYVGAETNLKQAANKLIDSKTEYENQAALSNSNSSSYASKLEAYDIDYLWTKLGNYAKDENVVIKIEVTAGSASSNLYNLNFTVTGTYVGTTDFIYDIENDTKLGFKIDNFKMINGSGSEVVGSFSCIDIPISVGSIENTTNEAKENETPSNVTQNTTNSTNTTNTTNNSKSTSNDNTNTNSSAANQYGISDPNHSNLTSIDNVITK